MSKYYKDYYKILGVDKKASAIDIKLAISRAYERYQVKSSDSFKDVVDKNKHLDNVKEAADVLSDEEVRCKYDRFIMIDNADKLTGRDIIDLVFIIDKSNSMMFYRDSIIEKFKDILADYYSKRNRVCVTIILYNEDIELLAYRMPIRDVDLLTYINYITEGKSSVYDTIGEITGHFWRIYNGLESSKVPGQINFFVITDGIDTYSKNYTENDISQLIEKMQRRFGCRFIFPELYNSIDILGDINH